MKQEGGIYSKGKSDENITSFTSTDTTQQTTSELEGRRWQAANNTQGQSILVIDDNAMSLDLFGDIFTIEGYTIYKANSAQDGIKLAQQYRPNIIVMDIVMPELDGIEATRQIKSCPITAESLVIACSALALPDIREEALEAGCDAYITKPVEPKHLVEQVGKDAGIF